MLSSKDMQTISVALLSAITTMASSILRSMALVAFPMGRLRLVRVVVCLTFVFAGHLLEMVGNDWIPC